MKKNIKLAEKTQNIYCAQDNCQYCIKNTPQHGILKSLGIVNNAKIHKVLTHRLGGPVLIKVGSCEIAIGKDIAEQILVGGE